MFIEYMKLLKIILGIYLLLCIGLYFAQEKVIFAAHQTSETEKYRAGYEVEIPLEGQLTMNTLIIPAATGTRSKGAIMYLHGNKGNIHRGIYQTRTMRNRGLDIMIIDYRSYGKTEDKPRSDKQMLTDAAKAYNYLKEHYDENQIYLVGYSLGTGMASYIAKTNNPAHLFLVAPFTNLTAIKDKYLWMFPDFLMKYKLDNAKHVKDLATPTTILHGTDDTVVDYKYSLELKKINNKIDLITSKGQSHRGIIFDPLLRGALDRIIP